MNFEETNILIAEFMGAKTQNYADRTVGFLFLEKIEGYHPSQCAQGLKYHCSWDWLMPVIKKINIINNGSSVVDPILNSILNLDLVAVYNKVVQYIILTKNI